MFAPRGSTIFDFTYKRDNSFEKRSAEASAVRERHPDRIPVICEKVGRSKAPDLDKNKFLVPADLSVAQFLIVVRKRLMLEPKQSLYIFINEAVTPGGAPLSDVYSQHKDSDGFLYVKYAAEDSFGAECLDASPLRVNKGFLSCKHKLNPQFSLLGPAGAPRI
jgi:GABA(A) receptor-associated protein